MKNEKLRAYRTLARIRVRRQEVLERERASAQAELARLTGLAEVAANEVAQAEQNVVDQIERIEQLVQAGNRFQIADYLAQQDYQASLEEKTALSRAENDKADAAVAQQEQVLRAARSAAAQNLRQRENLEEKVRDIELKIDAAHMDAEDEEAEEAVVTRKKLQAERLARDAAHTNHA